MLRGLRVVQLEPWVKVEVDSRISDKWDLDIQV